MSESLSNEKPAHDYSRLYWQCRRGMLELDYLLIGFLKTHYHQMDYDELKTFSKLLTHNDSDLLEYLMGREIPEDQDIAYVVKKIRRAAKDRA